MSVAAGIITIEFVANVSGRKLMEEFPDFLTKFGTVKLTNMNNEEALLSVHCHEVTYLDEESEDEDLNNEQEI